MTAPVITFEESVAIRTAALVRRNQVLQQLLALQRDFNAQLGALRQEPPATPAGAAELTG